jgi:hypothetical protein
LHPAGEDLLRRSGLLQYTETGMDEIRRGYAGRYAGFDIYTSIFLPANKIVGFIEGMPHFIQQLNEVKVKDDNDRVGYKILGEFYYQAAAVLDGSKAVVSVKYA